MRFLSLPGLPGLEGLLHQRSISVNQRSFPASRDIVTLGSGLAYTPIKSLNVIVRQTGIANNPCIADHLP